MCNQISQLITIKHFKGVIDMRKIDESKCFAPNNKENINLYVYCYVKQLIRKS